MVGGVPCTAYLGPNGAGHYVKMIHNGIEYIDMQLIGEAYWLLSNLLGMEADELSQVFAPWNAGDLDSYLIQITADILQQPDPDDEGGFLVDHILDTAGQKGTGKWTSVNALDMGIPANAIAEAVFARVSPSRTSVSGGKAPGRPEIPTPEIETELIDAIRDALYCSKICAYAQGFQLMREGRKNTTGRWISRRSRASGAADASSGRGSSRRSPTPTPATAAGEPAARSVLQRADQGRQTGVQSWPWPPPASPPRRS